MSKTLVVVGKGPSASLYSRSDVPTDSVVIAVNDAVEFVSDAYAVFCNDHEAIERVSRHTSAGQLLLVCPVYPHVECRQQHVPVSDEQMSRFKRVELFQLHTQSKYIDRSIPVFTANSTSESAVYWFCKHTPIAERTTKIIFYGVSSPPFTTQMDPSNPYCSLLKKPEYNLHKNVYSLKQREFLYESMIRALKDCSITDFEFR